MGDVTGGLGSVNASDAERVRLALLSAEWNKARPDYEERFGTTGGEAVQQAGGEGVQQAGGEGESQDASVAVGAGDSGAIAAAAAAAVALGEPAAEAATEPTVGRDGFNFAANPWGSSSPRTPCSSHVEEEQSGEQGDNTGPSVAVPQPPPSNGPATMLKIEDIIDERTQHVLFDTDWRQSALPPLRLSIISRVWPRPSCLGPLAPHTI